MFVGTSGHREVSGRGKWDHHPEAKEEQHMRGEIKTMSHVTAGRFIEMSELNYRN